MLQRKDALAHNGCHDPLMQHVAVHSFQCDMGEAIISLRLNFLLKSVVLHLEFAVESMVYGTTLFCHKRLGHMFCKKFSNMGIQSRADTKGTAGMIKRL